MSGMEDPHEIEIAMDGARLQLVTVGGKEDFAAMAENPGTFGADLDKRLTVRIPVKAGTHTIWATTVLKSHAPRDDLIKPFMRTTIDGLDIMGDPSVDRLTVEGPFARVGLGRHAVAPQDLHLQAGSAGGRRRRAPRKILSALARLAYRRPVDQATLDIADGFLPRGAQQRQQLRQRDRIRAAVHSRESGISVPLRDRSAERAAQHAPTA